MIEPIEPTDLTVAAGELRFEEFFEAQHDRLFKALFLLTGSADEADDIAQEALLRAYERWDRVGSMASPAGYVFRTALNLNRSRLRKAAVRARRAFHAIPSDDVSGRVALTEDVKRALDALSPPQREALILVEWLGLRIEETAAVLRIEPVSVRGRIHRARASLRRSLGGSGE